MTTTPTTTTTDIDYLLRQADARMYRSDADSWLIAKLAEALRSVTGRDGVCPGCGHAWPHHGKPAGCYHPDCNNPEGCPRTSPEPEEKKP